MRNRIKTIAVAVALMAGLSGCTIHATNFNPLNGSFTVDGTLDNGDRVTVGGNIGDPGSLHVIEAGR